MTPNVPVLTGMNPGFVSLGNKLGKDVANAGMRELDVENFGNETRREYLGEEKYKEQTNSEVYNLMILPTYACNVSCWYCTQRHRNIHLNEEDVLRIKKHIQFYLPLLRHK